MPVRLALLSVPLELTLLKAQAELLWAKPAGADPPQVHGKLTRHGDDGLFARGPGGQSAFGQNSSPFHDRFVIGLEADQPPGQFHQRRSQPRVAVLGHAALEPGVTATVFSGT